jgi:hypothetical protein
VTVGAGTASIAAVHVSPAFVFVSVWLNQMGVPVPVVPTLILAGAMAEVGGGLGGLTGLYQAHRQLERWGSNALVIAKFIPGLAIIAPPIAGATRMHPLRFSLSTLLGGCLWAAVALRDYDGISATTRGGYATDGGDGQQQYTLAGGKTPRGHTQHRAPLGPVRIAAGRRGLVPLLASGIRAHVTGHRGGGDFGGAVCSVCAMGTGTYSPGMP